VTRSRLWNVAWFALLVAIGVWFFEDRPLWPVAAVLLAVLGFGQLFVLMKVRRRERR